jgi:hypothetical protein
MSNLFKSSTMILIIAAGGSVSVNANANDCEYNIMKLDQVISTCGKDCSIVPRMKEIVAKSCGNSSTAVQTGIDKYSQKLRAYGNAQGTVSATTDGSGGAGNSTDAPTDEEPPRQDEPPAEKDAGFQPLDPNADYTGESCQFFTLPARELYPSGATKSLNYYADGSNVCYGGQMYICEKRRWKKGMQCSSYQDSWKYDAKRLEGTGK